jgi:hypothetical protein
MVITTATMFWALLLVVGVMVDVGVVAVEVVAGVIEVVF